MRHFIVLSLVLVAGVLLGWLLHGHLSDSGPPGSVPAVKNDRSEESITQRYAAGDLAGAVAMSAGDPAVIADLAAQDRSKKAVTLIERFIDEYGEHFDLRVRAIEILYDQGSYDTALVWIGQADLIAPDASAQSEVGKLLARVTESFAMELLSQKRFEAVDELYEGINFAMPERALYFLKLGLLRVQMGKYDEAMMPLAQIQNAHGDLGDRARDLIAQIESRELSLKVNLEEIPLRRYGNQFVVEATLDHEHDLRLLVDTGAAMTVIDQDVIEGFGYNLNGRPRELFATANGVVEAPVVTLGVVTLGDIAMTSLAVGALSLGMPDGVHGLLGMNFLRHYDFRIDQNRNMLEVRPR